MYLIIESFFLSFRVLVKMVVPLLGVLVASFVIWTIAGILTFGISDYFSEPITATFVTMLGVRVALLIAQHDQRRVDVMDLALLSIKYGLFLMVTARAMVVLTNLIAIVATDLSVGDLGSIQTFGSAVEVGLELFSPYAFSFMPIVFLVLLTIIPTAMAVPVAAAAASAGKGARGHRFFDGFGKSFLPVFAIFFVLNILLMGFDLLANIYLPLSLIAAVFSGGSISPATTEIYVIGMASGAIVLWLNSWIWSTSALALMKFEKGSDSTGPVGEVELANSRQDIRQLRQSRARTPTQN